jgi:hypothetical protein
MALLTNMMDNLIVHLLIFILLAKKSNEQKESQHT